MHLRHAARLGLAAAVFFCATVHAQDRPSLGTIARERGAAPAAAVRFATEQEWIVNDVVTAIEQMAAFAKHDARSATLSVRMAGGTPDGFLVSGPGIESRTIRVVDHLWSAATYAPVAASIRGDGPGCETPAPSPAVQALLEPTAEVLVAESRRISARLQTNMRCADAHHEAALLLGAMALREAAGTFSDVRRTLSRMTAHLAVADALAPADTTVKRLATAVQLTLVGRQQTAMAQVSALEAGRASDDVQAWVRALRLRNTRDWRGVRDASSGSLLEQLAAIRAFEASLGEAAAREKVDAFTGRPDVVDWMRLLVQHFPGVETGNRFTLPWITAEIAEASRALAALDPSIPLGNPDAMRTALNTEPADGPIDSRGKVAVIDAGTWAASSQRHIMMGVLAHHHHVARSIGLPADARAFRDDASRLFAGWKLYPLLSVAMAFSREEALRAMSGAAPFVRSRPELVTDAMWREFDKQARYAALTMPGDPVRWFTPRLPAGTVFDADSRTRPDGEQPRFTLAQIAELRRQAPYSRRLAEEAVRWKGASPSHAVLRQEYGELAAYDVSLARTLAQSAWNDPDVYVPAMERVCAMSDTGFYELAPYLADHGRPEEARRVYERWLAEGHNEVTISTSMQWLVRYYFDLGERAKAAALADRVAEVGSFGGMLTRANLYEWAGDLQAAEEQHRTAWKRYDSPSELLAFYLRTGVKGRHVDELLRDVFPTGITRAQPPGTVAPTDGVRIVYPGATGAAEGLQAKDIIVSVDGIRVRDVAQYRAARGASAAEAMRFTVWRGSKYVEVTARLRTRWVVSNVETYGMKGLAQ